MTTPETSFSPQNQEKAENKNTPTENMIDEKTGLPTKLWLDTHFDTLVEATEGKLALVFVDGDNMKDVNDVYGHVEGDAYIKNMAEALRDSFRTSPDERKGDHVVIHTSGDEFLVLLTDVDKSDADIAANRAKRNLDEIGAPISTGVALYHNGLTLNELIQEADKNMYFNKGGRTIEKLETNDELTEAIGVLSDLKEKLPGVSLRTLATLQRMVDENDPRLAEALKKD